MTGDGVKGTVEPDLLNQLLFSPSSEDRQSPHLAERITSASCSTHPVRKPWLAALKPLRSSRKLRRDYNRLQAFELSRVVHQLSGRGSETEWRTLFSLTGMLGYFPVFIGDAILIRRIYR